MTLATADRELLESVADGLAKMPSVTDHLMLTRWRVLSICQYVMGASAKDVQDACAKALQSFVGHGPSVTTHKALAAAVVAIKELVGSDAASVLPAISAEKRAAVDARLEELASLPGAIERALSALPSVRERVTKTARGALLPGISHRLSLASTIVEDSGRADRERARAAAAVLYVDEIHDVIPDSLGLMGMLDDDYALRIVLDELGNEGKHIHWSERISSLWDDLPFLQGVNLQRGEVPIAVTWLDRLSSYASYTHVLGHIAAPLVLLQPSVACSPLHSIVSLFGLMALDAMTSSTSKALALRNGQVYEIDEFVLRYEGTAGLPTPGWLRLRFRDGVLIRAPQLADRLVPVPARRLSSTREFLRRPRSQGADPMQRFFDWDDSIPATSINGRLVLVASRQRALDMLDGVQSNGVRLLDHGLVRFVGAGNDVEVHGTLLLVVPSLMVARTLMDRGIRVEAIIVDGYERLRCGRHELPFVMNRNHAPHIITWSAKGYYPDLPPSWLPPHKCLEVFTEDLESILELDEGVDTDTVQSSLWEAATSLAIQPRHVTPPSDERSVVDALDEYLRVVREAKQLPEYWQFHLGGLGRTLRLLVASTPAEWSAIRTIVSTWTVALAAKWSTLRTTASKQLEPIHALQVRVAERIALVRGEFNSKATALSQLLADRDATARSAYFVCDRPEQMKTVAALLRRIALGGVEPILLRDVAVCSNCIVGGWTSTSFARRLWAHTPRSLIALVDDPERQQWERAAARPQQREGQSLLYAVAGSATSSMGRETTVSSWPAEATGHSASDHGILDLTPCVFVWLSGEADAKVLLRNARVVVEEGDRVRERPATGLQPDDRVILGAGESGWSPAEEFTQAVIGAIESSQPELVRDGREWRRALHALHEHLGVTSEEVRSRLAAAGVQRELQTIEGWLDLERASPIAPMRLRTELKAIWALIERHTNASLEEVTAACARLRSLRMAAGRALLKLWKCRRVELGVDEDWLAALVGRLREEVQVYDVDAISLGRIPSAMLGSWISPELAARFESDDRGDDHEHSVAAEDDDEDSAD